MNQTKIFRSSIDDEDELGEWVDDESELCSVTISVLLGRRITSNGLDKR